MLGILQAFLARGWQVIFASAAALSPHRFMLADIGIEEHLIELNSSSFDEWLASLNPQAVMFDRFFTEEQFGWRVARTCPNAIRLLDTEDLHSLRAARHQLLKTSTDENPVDASLHIAHLVMAELDIAQRELAAIYRCDLTLMISRVEIELLTQHFQVPLHLLSYLPLGIAAEDIPDHFVPFVSRANLVVIGNFRHEPNWDSVLYLKKILWPLFRQKAKGTAAQDCELHIYGAYPPPKATQLHQPKEKFLVKGWADDAQDVLRNARLCFAPIRFGAGQKGKLLDAMLAGTPSVTTPVGAEAMYDQVADWPGIIANTAEDLCSAALSLYLDEAHWHQVQKAINPLLNSQFLLPPYWERFFSQINFIVENLSAHRLKNPVGRLLQFHQFKSTEYMGQWIEAKTRLAESIKDDSLITPLSK